MTDVPYKVAPATSQKRQPPSTASKGAYGASKGSAGYTAPGSSAAAQSHHSKSGSTADTPRRPAAAAHQPDRLAVPYRCAVYAFWTAGILERHEVDDLRAQVAGRDPAAIRRDAGRTAASRRWRAAPSLPQAATTFRPSTTRHVTATVSPSSPPREAPTPSLVVWAKRGDIDYVHPSEETSHADLQTAISIRLRTTRQPHTQGEADMQHTPTPTAQRPAPSAGAAARSCWPPSPGLGAHHRADPVHPTAASRPGPTWLSTSLTAPPPETRRLQRPRRRHLNGIVRTDDLIVYHANISSSGLPNDQLVGPVHLQISYDPTKLALGSDQQRPLHPESAGHDNHSRHHHHRLHRLHHHPRAPNTPVTLSYPLNLWSQYTGAGTIASTITATLRDATGQIDTQPRPPPRSSAHPPTTTSSPPAPLDWAPRRLRQDRPYRILDPLDRPRDRSGLGACPAEGIHLRRHDDLPHSHDTGHTQRHLLPVHYQTGLPIANPRDCNPGTGLSTNLNASPFGKPPDPLATAAPTTWQVGEASLRTWASGSSSSKRRGRPVRRHLAGMQLRLDHLSRRDQLDHPQRPTRSEQLRLRHLDKHHPGRLREDVLEQRHPRW